MANEAKYARATTINVVTAGGTAIPSSGFTAGATFDASSSLYPLGELELRATLNTTTTGGTISVYLLPIAADDTSYPEDVDADFSAYYVGSFSVKDNIATEQVCITDIKLPSSGKGKIFLKNEIATASSTGWDLDLTPYTMAPAA